MHAHQVVPITAKSLKFIFVGAFDVRTIMDGVYTVLANPVHEHTDHPILSASC